MFCVRGALWKQKQFYNLVLYITQQLYGTFTKYVSTDYQSDIKLLSRLLSLVWSVFTSNTVSDNKHWLVIRAKTNSVQK